jgi:uncharacterized protein YkwD
MYPFSHPKTAFWVSIGAVSLAMVVLGCFSVYGDRVPADAGQASVLGVALESSSQSAYGDYTDAASLDHLALNRTNIIWFTNYYRVRASLPELKTQVVLHNSAYAKIRDMIAFRYFDHERASGTVGLETFLDNEHYDFIKAGENLAMGDFTTSKEVVDAWMNSPMHRRNILDAKSYTELGVSVTPGDYHGKPTTFIVQHFGKPKKNCPMVDRGLKDRIADLKNQMERMLDDATKYSESKDYYNYQETINQYNASVEQLNSWVGVYNTQVKAFEHCVAQYTF